jgi:uncharacterized repeat protein (TIGR03803 family)
MASQHQQIAALIFDSKLGARAAALFSLAILVAIISLAPSAQAQTFTVLHNFTGEADGASPYGSLAIDRNGNLYGAATFGGNAVCQGTAGVGCGVIFKVTHRGAGWVFASLYKFGTINQDGANPVATPTIAADGTIYGTTDSGGTGGCYDISGGCGTVYRLRPLPSVCAAVSCPWRETVLYRFTGNTDGANPTGEMVLDAAGNLYGTAQFGVENNGVVFQVSPVGNSWAEVVLHTFGFGNDGELPYAGLTLDTSGNLYGTTVFGGSRGAGTVFQLTPSGSGWTENLLYSFQGGEDGANPATGLILDPAGNLNGVNQGNPLNVVFRLSPFNGGWNFSNLYSFQGNGVLVLHSNTLARDAFGDLFGTEFAGGINCSHGCGSVFELTPTESGYSYVQLYQFTGGSDGGNPAGGVVLDTAGNIYGTTITGGAQGGGTVWEITPQQK